MTALIRSRDFETQQITKACESEVVSDISGNVDDIDRRAYNLSLLNEKLRVFRIFYFLKYL